MSTRAPWYWALSESLKSEKKLCPTVYELWPALIWAIAASVLAKMLMRASNSSLVR